MEVLVLYYIEIGSCVLDNVDPLRMYVFAFCKIIKLNSYLFTKQPEWEGLSGGDGLCSP